ncbi:MAG: hypothetical protein N3A01_06440 [Bacteroidales bacterium]|nr:hypothetical protein [Bacteroidales bacterium]
MVTQNECTSFYDPQLMCIQLKKITEAKKCVLSKKIEKITRKVPLKNNQTYIYTFSETTLLIDD